MTITLTAIITALGSIVTYLAGQKWLFPVITKLLKYKHDKDNETLDINKKLIDVEKNNNELYQNQITFFSKQVDILQKQLTEKQKEFEVLQKALSALKNQLIEAQNMLIDKDKQIVKLKEFYCGNTECTNRIRKINTNKLHKEK